MLTITDIRDLWRESEKNDEEELVKETIFSWVLKNLALSSETMLYLTTVAVNGAVAAALKEQFQVPSNFFNAANRQRTRPMVLDRV